MNERIQELADYAKEYATTRHPVSEIVLNVDAYLFEQKFAELIVRECGQVLVNNTPAVQLHGNCYNQGYDRAMNDCIHHIYEHFGLEE